MAAHTNTLTHIQLHKCGCGFEKFFGMFAATSASPNSTDMNTHPHSRRPRRTNILGFGQKKQRASSRTFITISSENINEYYIRFYGIIRFKRLMDERIHAEWNEMERRRGSENFAMFRDVHFCLRQWVISTNSTFGYMQLLRFIRLIYCGFFPPKISNCILDKLCIYSR